MTVPDPLGPFGTDDDDDVDIDGVGIAEGLLPRPRVPPLVDDPLVCAIRDLPRNPLDNPRSGKVN